MVSIEFTISVPSHFNYLVVININAIITMYIVIMIDKNYIQ